MRGRLTQKLIDAHPIGYSGPDRRWMRYMARPQDLNNGSHAGGVGSVLQNVLMGYMAGQDRREAKQGEADQLAAERAMLSGYSARPWIPPKGEVIHDGPSSFGDSPITPSGGFRPKSLADRLRVPGSVIENPVPDKAGGFDGAMFALSKLQSNPAAVRLSSSLMLDDVQRQQRQAELAADRAYKESQAPRFERVDSPYGLGGVGQVNTKTGQIVGYQGPDKGQDRDSIWVFDKNAKTTRLVPRSDVLANGDQYLHPSAAPSDRYVSRRRPMNDTNEVFEVSQDGGKTWSAVGEPYQRGGDPMDAILSTLFGNPDKLLDGGGDQNAPVPASSPNDENTLYQQALEAEQGGANLDVLRQRLEENGGSWAEFERFRAGNGG